MNGRELSAGLFRDVVLPALQLRFREHVDSLSAAAVGEGSDVLGYDDAISQDHNFCPRVALFLPDELHGSIGETLSEALTADLPTHYAGVPLAKELLSPALQVLGLRRYHERALDVPALPSSDAHWLLCDEQKLLELTAGAIFHDPSGQLGAIRRQLAYYPPGVRLYLLRTCFARMSESAGVERSIRREDWIATNHYVSCFVYFAIRAAHLLSRRYCPYHKWMAYSLQRIGPEDAELHSRLERLVCQGPANEPHRGSRERTTRRRGARTLTRCGAGGSGQRTTAQVRRPLERCGRTGRREQGCGCNAGGGP